MVEGPSAMKRVAAIIMLIMAVSWPVWADDSAFCHDPAMWDHFDTMAADYPEDVPLQILHALKIGLCVKISQGSISTGAAITLFNDMLDTVANKRGEDAEQAKSQKEKEL
jgi:hypothetical protein